MSGMHLVKGMTSLNLKSRKNKKRNLTISKIAKYEAEMRAYNKKMRQIHAHDQQMDLQQYIDYCFGDYKPKPRSEAKSYEPNEPYRRTTPHIPSRSAKESIGGTAPRKEPNVYTGDLIVGIGTMHKSNAVPIMRGTNEAKDLAKMRR